MIDGDNIHGRVLADANIGGIEVRGATIDREWIEGAGVVAAHIHCEEDPNDRHEQDESDGTNVREQELVVQGRKHKPKGVG